MTSREFIGTDWEPELVSAFSEKMESLLSRCPSDASEKTRFEKRGDVYFGEVSFKSLQGAFTARCLDKSTAKVLDVLTRTIEAQISVWHDHRDGEKPALPVKSFAGKNVLVVDDDSDSARLLERGLRSLGCNIHLVSDAAEACLELARKSFDLVFLDWLMPEFNGGEALKRAEKIITANPLYSKKHLQSETPVVIYSSENVEHLGGMPQSTIFKFVDYWHKPYAYKNMLSRLPEVLAAT